MLNYQSLLSLVLCLVTVSAAVAQGGYHVTHYAPHEYGAGNQNWDISSDGRRLFLANNFGLMVVDGQAARLHRLPQGSIVRSVAAIGDRVYTGSFQEFGYWVADESGALAYTSLVPLHTGTSLANEEFWTIHAFDGAVYFQSFGRILRYDLERVTEVEIPGAMMFLHAANGRLMAQMIRGGLHELDGGRMNPIAGSGFLADTEVKAILPLSNREWLIGTSTRGVYRYDGSTFSRWSPATTAELTRMQINHGIRVGDRIVFGTILRGLYIYSPDGSLVKQVNTESGLMNNTVLTMMGDERGNVWVGLDKGYAHVAFDSPVTVYRDERGGIGSVYSAAMMDDALYVGTNQGIHVYRRMKDGRFADRRFLPGSEGQVWFLHVVDDRLYAGLNDGTFVLEGDRLVRVSDVTGGYTFKRITGTDTPRMLQSTYGSLVLYRRERGVWRKDRELAGFSAPGRYMERDPSGAIWVGHSIQGIFRLLPDDRLDSITRVQPIGEPTNRVFLVDSRILIANDEGLKQWDPLRENLVPYEGLNSLLGEDRLVLNLIPAGSGRYWVVRRDEVDLVEIRFGTVRELYRLAPAMYGLTLVQGHETVIALDDGLHLICLDDGFAMLNLNSVAGQDVRTDAPVVHGFRQLSGDGQRIVRSDGGSVSYRYNTLAVEWSSGRSAGMRPFYQTRLLGVDERWSEWDARTASTYERLPPGTYTFEVRMLTESGRLSEVARKSVRIRSPWYLSPPAWVLYVLLLTSFGVMIRLYLSRRRWKKREHEMQVENESVRVLKEKAENDLMQMANDKLQNEVAHKSSQLANSTMAMIRKNELLGRIRDELDAQRTELGLRYPARYHNRLVRLIDQGLKDEMEWEQFENLYDQAHSDFFKRLKADHPLLTPSDLRLCAYLRMNLSSKEIAPLLNITVRGVEERRYRLRKRLDLRSDQNLTELIMTY
jgi:ligand-binding sensor domain-containing protein/DNA-binding CsgD family transcriptional regulator